MLRRFLPAFCAAGLSASIVFGSPPLANSVEEALEKIKADLTRVRTDESDLKVSRGWDIPFTIAPVEKFFDKPLDMTVTSSKWSDRVEKAEGMAGLYDAAFEILAATSDRPELIPFTRAVPTFPPAFPKSLRPLLVKIYQAAATASPLVKKAAATVSEDERKRFLSLNEWPIDDEGTIQQEISARRIKSAYAAMKHFDETTMRRAGREMVIALEPVLVELDEWRRRPEAQKIKRLRWRTPYGDILVSGPGDDIYTDEAMERVVALIDLGGRNAYQTAVAAAGPGDIRVAMDWGSDVSISGVMGANAGSGVFGIGLLYLPNPEGKKEILCGSFSQGVGLGGLGGLFIKGPARVEGHRTVQGAGIFGVGILDSDASGSRFKANRTAQGIGFVRGVGIFRHKGNNTEIMGGLVEPDPREPMGSVSLCQGIGVGHRAYAGGGVGIATVLGDENVVNGSYFAMGCGYWHSLGIFRARGDKNLLQARRYDLGSGVHYAFGHFELRGDNNRVLNWGVGPAYGWDHAMGSAYIEGNKNEMQTDWGAANAAFGSLSVSLVRGNDNKLRLTNLAGGGFSNNDPAYALHRTEGSGNSLQSTFNETSQPAASSMYNPWSYMSFGGGLVSTDLKLTPAQWPTPEREQALKREAVDLQARLSEAGEKETEAPEESVADLVDVASAFSLDKETPRQALLKLMLLPPEKVPLLIEVLEPAAVDQLIQLRFAIPAHGERSANAILDVYKETPNPKRLMIFGMLSDHRPSLVSPHLFAVADNPESELKMRLTALKVLGSLLNDDPGAEPGVRASLRALSEALKHPSGKKHDEALALISRLRLSQGLGLLNIARDLTNEEKAEFFGSFPKDLTETLQKNGSQKLFEITQRKHADSLAAVEKEIIHLKEIEPRYRKELVGLLKSTQTAELYTALVGLGQAARAEDAPLIAPFLTHSASIIRESAAVALARMGEAALPIFKKVLLEGDVRSRCLAVTSAYHAVSPKAAELIDKGLNDADATVRLTATGLIGISEGLTQFSKKKPALKKMAEKRFKVETDPDVRFALRTYLRK